MRAFGIAYGVFLILGYISLGYLITVKMTSTARADFVQGVHARALFVVGSGYSLTSNVTGTPVNGSTGIYTITLTTPCYNASPWGDADGRNDRGDIKCSAAFTSASTVDISCRNGANNLVNMPNGTNVRFTAWCGHP